MEGKNQNQWVAVAAIDIDARADCREFVGGVLGADIVPPGLGAEDGGPEIIGSADIRASDGVEDQSEDAATVISNRSTDRGLAGGEVEAKGPDVVGD